MNLEPLRDALALMQEGGRELPWQLWTSNSHRRISKPHGQDGGVLHAYNQRSDNHPDLSMPEDQLEALVTAVNALPDLIAEITRQREVIEAWHDIDRKREAEVEKLRDVATKALERTGEGWANAIEFGLIPPQHRNAAQILADDARAAIAALKEPSHDEG